MLLQFELVGILFILLSMSLVGIVSAYVCIGGRDNLFYRERPQLDTGIKTLCADCLGGCPRVNGRSVPC